MRRGARQKRARSRGARGRMIGGRTAAALGRLAAGRGRCAFGNIPVRDDELVAAGVDVTRVGRAFVIVDAHRPLPELALAVKGGSAALGNQVLAPLFTACL